MQWQRQSRFVADGIIPLTFVCLAVLASCRDITKPTRDDSGDLGTEYVTMQVRGQLTILDSGGPRRPRPFVQQATVPVVYWPGLTNSNADGALLYKTGSGGTRIRHFRDGSGRIQSIALYYERQDSPPKFIYAFEDGHIQSVVSPVYERHGKGFIRRRTRWTLFAKDGTPIAQSDMATDLSSRVRQGTPLDRLNLMAAVALKDITRIVSPKELHAEEVDAVNCVSEWTFYTTAGFALAAASTAVMAASVLCFRVPNTLSCSAMEAAVIRWGAALAAWSVALDHLATCLEKTRTGGGGSGSHGIDGFDDSSGQFTQGINDFINSSIAGGHYACTRDGDYCVYYAAF